jgi:hypothetical protein
MLPHSNVSKSTDLRLVNVAHPFTCVAACNTCLLNSAFGLDVWEWSQTLAAAPMHVASNTILLARCLVLDIKSKNVQTL